MERDHLGCEAFLFQSAWVMDAGSRGWVQRHEHSRFVLSWRSLLLFYLGVLDCELKLRVGWLTGAESGSCCVGVVSGVWWGSYDLGRCCIWKFIENVNLHGGPLYCGFLSCKLWVSIWVGWVMEGVAWGSCCVGCFLEYQVSLVGWLWVKSLRD